MISVIIPVYNTGPYLRDCIDSICNQTYRDLQIIIVDDGSESETAEICDELALKDCRIKVIHKANEGVSRARNTGLKLVQGEIVCFVDSDDTIHSDMFRILYDAMKEHNADIAMCDMVTIHPDGSTSPDTIYDFGDSAVFIPKSDITPSTLSRVAGSACRCAYRTDTLQSVGSHFPEGLKFSEDRLFNLMAMSTANRMVYIKKPLYNRLIRQGSACFKFYPDMTDQIVRWRRELLKILNQSWGPNYVHTFERQVAGHIHSSITNFTASFNRLSYREQRRLISEMCSNREITDCLNAYGASDLRSRLIKKKHSILLYLIGKLTNKYHKICRKGQYQA